MKAHDNTESVQRQDFGLAGIGTGSRDDRQPDFAERLEAVYRLENIEPKLPGLAVNHMHNAAFGRGDIEGVMISRLPCRTPVKTMAAGPSADHTTSSATCATALDILHLTVPYGGSRASGLVPH
jgi:hypothetical protein